jgi:SAM-dependent methyltransferase
VVITAWGASVNELYQNPKYYEIAFSFRDIPTEVDVFEGVITQYSRIPVSCVLELGCGPAPHLEELARRGYTYVGLDLSGPMLAYAQKGGHNPGIR